MPGPEIFLSYNREDAARAKQFAEAFAVEGFDVWWDVALRSGEAYDQVTEDALHNAKAVVVLWSPRSVVSRWVRAEATQAERNKTLVPAMIEPCRRPIMFELTQTAELSHWKGDTRDHAWQEFIKDVRNFVGREAHAPTATPTPTAKAKPERGAKQSIVVLPFLNMGGDPEQEYFADGITEDIITDLSKVSALSVISRNSAFTFKGKHVDIVEVATQLNVDHVLEGSVRKAGNRVRVTAQLIDGMNNDHLWAERFDRDLDDIFELQDELSQEIVKALKIKLVPAEKKAITSRGTDDPDAYDCYLRARALFSSLAPDSIIKSIEVFNKAVEIDPGFATAWAGLAEAYNQALVYRPQEWEHDYKDLRDAALARAYKLAPTSQAVNVARSYQFLKDHDWSELEKLYAAWDGKADHGWGFFNLIAATMGQTQKAVEGQLELRRADPLSVGISFVFQLILDCAGRMDDAEAEYERSLELPGEKITAAWRAVTRAIARKDHKRVKECYIDHFENDMQFMPFRHDLIGVIDDPKKAMAVLREASESPSCQDGSRLGTIASFAMHYDDPDFATEMLYRGMVELNGFTLIDIWQPLFVPIRNHPRFKQMVKDVGLIDYWRKSGNWGDFARPVGEGDFEMIA